jgi:hypothetical protein
MDHTRRKRFLKLLKNKTKNNKKRNNKTNKNKTRNNYKNKNKKCNLKGG